MKQFLKEAKILIFLFLILTTVTVLSYVDINVEKTLQKTPQDILQSAESKSDIEKISFETEKRKPASIESKKNETIKADVFCKSKTQFHFKKTSLSLMMLNLNICENLKSNRHVWIKNSANGFKAQVFKIGENNFRTDFIQLNEGANTIIIEAVLKDGQKRVQSLEIISGS